VQEPETHTGQHGDINSRPEAHTLCLKEHQPNFVLSRNVGISASTSDQLRMEIIRPLQHHISITSATWGIAKLKLPAIL
jgi:hypothetical protein